MLDNQYAYIANGTVAANKVVGAGDTKIPPTYTSDSTSVSDVVPIKTTIPSSYTGMGYGKRIYTNDAKMPVLAKSVDPVSAYYVCQSNDIVVNSTTYLKRTARRAEFVAFAAESPLLSPVTVKDLEQGTAQTTSALSPLVSNSNDRDCNSDQASITQVTRTNLASNPWGSKIVSSWTGFNSNPSENGVISSTSMPGKTLDFNDPRWATGGTAYMFAYLTTGSSGPLSSEACNSRYGIQDAIGNASEWNSDLFYCDPSWGCSPAFTNLAQTIAFNPVIDSANKSNYKNASNNKTFFMIDSQSTNSSSSSLGSPLTKDDDGNSPKNSQSTFKFFNIMLGLPMNCDGVTCQSSGANDDNVLITTQASAIPLETTTFNFNAGTYFPWNNPAGQIGTSGARDYSIAQIIGMASGGESSTGRTADRYSLSFGTRDFTGYQTPNKAPGSRCMVLLPETY